MWRSRARTYVRMLGSLKKVMRKRDPRSTGNGERKQSSTSSSSFPSSLDFLVHLSHPELFFRWSGRWKKIAHLGPRTTPTCPSCVSTRNYETPRIKKKFFCQKQCAIVPSAIGHAPSKTLRKRDRNAKQDTSILY